MTSTQLSQKTNSIGRVTWIPRAGLVTGAPWARDMGANNGTMQYSSKEARERIEELQSSNPDLYPRYKSNSQARNIRSLLGTVDSHATGDTPALPQERIEGKADPQGRGSGQNV